MKAGGVASGLMATLACSLPTMWSSLSEGRPGPHPYLAEASWLWGEKAPELTFATSRMGPEETRHQDASCLGSGSATITQKQQ